MPCDHKFQSDLLLENIDFDPVTLIVGTFIPAWPAGNTGPWFYGNTSKNYFWDLLPRLFGEPTLINATPADWKQFCHDKKIALTDLIGSIEDANPNDPEHNNVLTTFPDKAIVYNFDDFDFVDVVKILRQHPSIKNVYLTRGITEAFWKHVWNPVTHYCNQNNIRERILLTPSAGAEYQHGAHNHEHPDNQIPLLQDYILMKWQEQWHD